MDGLTLRRGDHVCAMYSTPSELVDTVAEFIADGLHRHQRCWYVTSGDETDAIRTELTKRNVDVAGETARGRLKLISGDGPYLVHGSFDPEKAIQTFNDAIEQAYADGFTGFRAAAEMSWALGDHDRASQLIVYEALLRALFSTSRAIGLCLYDRTRTPLHVLDGVLATHPVLRCRAQYQANKYYDPAWAELTAVEDAVVVAKLRDCDPA